MTAWVYPSHALQLVAVIGALTCTVGNRETAALSVVGGVTYGLAGGTFLFTDRLNFLFPGAGAIGLWVLATGIGATPAPRATSPAPRAA